LGFGGKLGAMTGRYRWHAIAPLLVTILSVVAIELVQRTGPRVPFGGAWLLLLVVWSAYTGGRQAGLASTAITGFWLWLDFAPPGTWFHSTSATLRPVVLWMVLGPATSFLVGSLKKSMEGAAQRYRDLVDGLDAIVWEADAETLRFSFVSRGAEQVLGYSIAQWLDDPGFWSRRLHPEDRDAAVSSRQQKAAAHLDHELEYRMIAADGRVVWVRDKARLHRDEKDRSRRLRGVLLDITERKQAEQALREAAEPISALTGEAFFRNLVLHLTRTLEADYAWAGKMVPGDPERIRTVAHAAGGAMAENFEYTWAGTPCVAVVNRQPRCYPRDVRRQFPQAPILTEKGIESYAGTPLFDASGEFQGLLVVLSTKPMRNPETAMALLRIFAARAGAELARARVEQQLRQSEERFRPLAETDLLIPWEADAATWVFTYVGPQAVEILGYPVEEWYRPGFWENHLHPEDREWAVKFCQEASQTRSSYEFEYRMIAAGGRTVWVHDLVAVIAGPEGNGKLCGFLVDISRRREAEEARNRLEQELRQSQKMDLVGRLAGGVAHDFNNLLTAISGYSELLLERFRPRSPYRKEVEEIRKACERAASLTRQLLAFSRKQVLAPKVLDLNAVLAGMEQMLRRLIGEDIELRSFPRASPALVEADPGQLEQVILNLAVNAREAMPRGGQLTLETANVSSGEAGVLLAVTDTGAGMSESTRAQIFEPFFTTKELGTGLGLSTVYGIVVQSGGRIEVSSAPGEGTTFHIYLPLAQRPLEPEQTRAGKAPPVRRSATVLLVEDEDAVRNLVQAILRPSGYRVLEAPNGLRAIQLCQEIQDRVDLLLTDVVMPGMTGPELFTRLALAQPAMKVLYMSGYTGQALGQAGLIDEGTLLQKPFSADGLKSKIQQVLSQFPGPT